MWKGESQIYLFLVLILHTINQFFMWVLWISLGAEHETFRYYHCRKIFGIYMNSYRKFFWVSWKILVNAAFQ